MPLRYAAVVCEHKENLCTRNQAMQVRYDLSKSDTTFLTVNVDFFRIVLD